MKIAAERPIWLTTDSVTQGKLGEAYAGMRLAEFFGRHGVAPLSYRLERKDSLDERTKTFHRLENWLPETQMGGSPALVAAMKEEAFYFVPLVALDEKGDLMSLFTDRKTRIDSALAPVYRVKAAGGRAQRARRNCHLRPVPHCRGTPRRAALRPEPCGIPDVPDLRGRRQCSP